MEIADFVTLAALAVVFGYLIYRDKKNDKKFNGTSPSYRDMNQPSGPQQER